MLVVAGQPRGFTEIRYVIKKGRNKMLDIRLKHLRKINNRTQQDIADLIGITRPAYTAYEQGVRNPDYETLIKIADYYK